MMILLLAKERLIAFVLIDSSANPVIGLGSTFTVEISKNGGAFAAGSGIKAEIGNGWYTYRLTAGETDTQGPLAVKATGAGAVQQNLLYQVSGAAWEPGTETYILTTTEAATVLRCADDDANMLMLLPAIDAYIKMATGRDWAGDSPVRQEAKNAARMLLVQWHENPAMVGNQSVLGFGLLAALTQLEAVARYYYTFEGLSGTGYIYLKEAREGDTVVSLVGRVGASGDQSANFESIISIDDYIRQISDSDLSDKWFTAFLVPPQEI
jgi:hypothetical protein